MNSAPRARILVVEDLASTALLISRLLRNEGHSVRHVTNGALALERLGQESFDLVVTDWQMPEMDGLELVRRMRARPGVSPPIVMQTVIDTAEDRERALLAGADDYLTKPWRHRHLLDVVQHCLLRSAPQPTATVAAPQPSPFAVRPVRVEPPMPSASEPPFAAVVIAASTGGPDAVRKVVTNLQPSAAAAYLIVVHGPAWMLEAYTAQLGRGVALPVHLAATGMQIEPGHVYIAPGDRHTVVESDLRLRLIDTPPENHMRPAADPLFRTAADVFGRCTVGVVMTGLGQDGTVGASLVFAAGGHVLVQQPDSCVAPSMPRSVIAAGIPCESLPLDALAPAIGERLPRSTRTNRSF